MSTAVQQEQVQAEVTSVQSITLVKVRVCLTHYIYGLTRSIRSLTECLCSLLDSLWPQNLLRTAVSSVAQSRKLFPDSCFQVKRLTGLTVHTLLPTRPEAKLLINWLERGVFDALDRRYLSDVIFSIHTKDNQDLILLESYHFHIDYPSSNDSGDASIGVTSTHTSSDGTRTTQSSNRIGASHTVDHDNTTDSEGSRSSNMTSNQDSNVPPATKRDKNDKEAIRDSTVRLIKTLTTATESMPPLPKNSFVTITLQYRDDTPQDYEPLFFKSCLPSAVPKFLDSSTESRVGEVGTTYHQVSVTLHTGSESVMETITNRQVPREQPVPEREERYSKLIKAELTLRGLKPSDPGAIPLLTRSFPELPQAHLQSALRRLSSESEDDPDISEADGNDDDTNTSDSNDEEGVRLGTQTLYVGTRLKHARVYVKSPITDSNLTQQTSQVDLPSPSQPPFWTRQIQIGLQEAASTRSIIGEEHVTDAVARSIISSSSSSSASSSTTPAESSVSSEVRRTTPMVTVSHINHRGPEEHGGHTNTTPKPRRGVQWAHIETPLHHGRPKKKRQDTPHPFAPRFRQHSSIPETSELPSPSSSSPLPSAPPSPSSVVTTQASSERESVIMPVSGNADDKMTTTKYSRSYSKRQTTTTYPRQLDTRQVMRPIESVLKSSKNPSNTTTDKRKKATKGITSLKPPPLSRPNQALSTSTSGKGLPPPVPQRRSQTQTHLSTFNITLNKGTHDTNVDDPFAGNSPVSIIVPAKDMWQSSSYVFRPPASIQMNHEKGGKSGGNVGVCPTLGMKRKTPETQNKGSDSIDDNKCERGEGEEDKQMDGVRLTSRHKRARFNDGGVFKFAL